jgi:hypothetical protein
MRSTPDAGREAEPAVLIGHVTAPSGTLLLLDAGMVGIWSSDREPTVDPEKLGAELASALNERVDLRAHGRDAIEAVRRFDSASGRPPYLFDMPRGAVLRVIHSFAEMAQAHGLDAALEITPQRVPHRTRVTELLAATPGLVEIPFHEMWAVGLDGMPMDRRIPLYGTRMPAGSDHAGCWASVWLQLSDAPVVRSDASATVLVERARLLFSDADALGAWKHDEPIDGRIDVVFWGRDAAAAARESAANKLSLPGQDAFGWVDCHPDDAIEVYNRVEALKGSGLKFALDFRPHSHAFTLLEQIRATETESGEVEVGGALLCGFATTWGDGVFEVHRDVSADGSVARVRIEMATPPRLAAMRRVQEQARGLTKIGVASARIMADGQPVRWLYREVATADNDSGWYFFAGDERGDYLDNSDNARVVPVREILARFPQLEAILQTPAPCAFELDGDDGYVQVTDWSPDDGEE